MKYRSDFVTNSSSSSFIFRENHLKKKEESMLGELRAMIDGDKHWREDGDFILDEARYICKNTKRFREFTLQELEEVYEWYFDDVTEALSDRDAADFTEEEIALAAKAIVIRIILQRYDDGLWASFDKSDQQAENSGICMTGEATITHEQVEEALYSAFNRNEESYWWDPDEQKLHKWLEEDFTRIMDAALECAGRMAGDLMEEFFGAKYMYFDGEETHYFILEIVSKYEEFVRGCCHMG